MRGERVDVAIGVTEKFLDDAIRSGDEEVLIIHGHGTGALRDALRKELKHFPGVASVVPADPSNGGDGASIVKLGCRGHLPVADALHVLAVQRPRRREDRVDLAVHTAGPLEPDRQRALERRNSRTRP